MTESQTDLLKYLSTRMGVVPVPVEKRPDLHKLHELGFVAIFADGVKCDFALITEEGDAALHP